VTADLEGRFAELVGAHGDALWRLGRGYERDPDRRRDLHQEILVALWRALPSFEGRCSPRTFVLRVAHNTACSWVLRAVRNREELRSLEDLEAEAPDRPPDDALDDRIALERLAALVRTLVPMDRQLLLLHLEGLDPRAIAEVTGLSPTNVTTKVSRIKALLVKRLGMES
jgi:RNA polymerase sigma-70 factor (ECF subfamily)